MNGKPKRTRPRGTNAFSVKGAEPEAARRMSTAYQGLIEIDPAESEFADLIAELEAPHVR
jgi:hypothetical protein